jgi:SAM-dependent methyltransferase
MSSHPYYGSDLAWVHHVGYSHHAEQTGPGVVALLREGGLAPGASVLDVGCGSGLLARQLRAAGFAVRGVDASPAMLELARDCEPDAKFDVVSLPTGLQPGDTGALPQSDAVVSTGHVLNYLDTRAQIAQALGELARAVRPGGLLAIDLMTEAFCHKRGLDQIHAKVQEDWVIVTFLAPRAVPVRPGNHRLPA